jgi:hypothetical protein
MTVVPDESTLTAEDSAVTLPRYAQIIQNPPCAFFGVRRDSETEYECRDVWMKHYRDNIAHYLAEAQQELEDFIGYFLMPRWVVGLPDGSTPERQIDNQQYSQPMHDRQNYMVLAKWGYVIEAGKKATASIADGAAVDHTSDPAVVGPIATTVTDTSEVKVYHPDTMVEIHPSAMTISGGNLTITIPRCRMVKSALADNPSGGLDYDDVTNFETTVDVIREYCDPSEHAVLIWPHKCSALSCCTCSDYRQDGCIYIKNPRLGMFDVLPAAYSSGSWTCATCFDCDHDPEYIQMYYRAGIENLTRQMEDAIVRLAHAKMPDEPCGCEISQRLWARDRNIPTALTRERANCPFGMRDGAWVAYEFARTFKLHRPAIV